MYTYTLISTTEFKIENVTKNFSMNYIGDETLAISETDKFNLRELNENKVTKLKQNAASAQAKIDTAFVSFPKFEIDTFASQQRDYVKYQDAIANNIDPLTLTYEFATDLLIVGETLASLMTRIGGNMTYVKGVQKVMRQTSFDIKACTTQAELDAIVF